VLPATLKAEVKLTTGEGVSVAARELAALEVPGGGGLGLVAVIFVGGSAAEDGRWVLVDAAAWRGRSGESVSAARSVLAALVRGQPHLDRLRCHVEETWPRFLVAFRDAAEAGHTALVEALEAAHREGTTPELLPRDPVLAYERREAVRTLVERHGEADAGRLAQDLLAYVLAFAGWRKVTLNPVGVPDFALEQLAAQRAPAQHVTLTLPSEDAERAVALFRAAGEHGLALDLEARIVEARRF
jgi:hypothetical protein